MAKKGFNFGRLFGNTVSTAAGTAAGAATAGALAPLLQEEINLTWSQFPNRPVAAAALAAGVAQGQVDPVKAKAEARLSGYSGTAFNTMVDIANVGPPLQSAYDNFRRGVWDQAEFDAALNRLGIEPEWWRGLQDLASARLSPDEVANAVQQGHLRNDDILPPIVGGQLPLDIPLTQIDLDPLTEAAAAGIDGDRLKVKANLSGLPPPQGELLTMWRRGIITEAAVEAGIREGHTKTKWVSAVKEMKRTYLTPIEYVDAHLRGYISEAEMNAGTALHGLTADDTKILFESHGRPLTVHQITTGLARGGTYDGDTSGIDAVYLDSLKEGSIKPPFYNLAYANRYSLPSFFVVRALLQDGTLTEARAADLFKQEGWPPDLAEAAAKAYAVSGTGKINAYVTKARGYVFTLLHKSYVDTPVYDAKAREGMTLLGIGATDQDEILKLFKFELTIGPAAAPPPTVPAA